MFMLLIEVGIIRWEKNEIIKWLKFKKSHSLYLFSSLITNSPEFEAFPLRIVFPMQSQVYFSFFGGGEIISLSLYQVTFFPTHYSIFSCLETMKKLFKISTY